MNLKKLHLHLQKNRGGLVGAIVAFDDLANRTLDDAVKESVDVMKARAVGQELEFVRYETGNPLLVEIDGHEQPFDNKQGRLVLVLFNPPVAPSSPIPEDPRPPSVTRLAFELVNECGRLFLEMHRATKQSELSGNPVEPDAEIVGAILAAMEAKCHEIVNSKKMAQAADMACFRAMELVTFIQKNVGNTADFPMRIACDNPMTYAELIHRLEEADKWSKALGNELCALAKRTPEQMKAEIERYEQWRQEMGVSGPEAARP